MAITNTLIKKLQEVKSEGESYKDANFHKNKKSEIENVFLPSFEKMVQRFDEVLLAYTNLIAIKELKGVSIELDLLSDSIKALKDKVIKDDYDKQYVLNLKKNLDANYEYLLGIWKDYISNKTSSRAEMLVTLDKLIAGMPEKQALELKKAAFSSAKIGAPTAVEAIKEYIKIYDDLMNKLKLKDNVSGFLKKLASGERVSLLDMDEDVYKWIKESGFANKIVLKVN